MARTITEKESVKQVYLNENDRRNVEIVARILEREGIDVRRAGAINLTKVVRYLVAQAAKGQSNG